MDSGQISTPSAPSALENPTRVRFLIVGLTTLTAFLLYLDRFCLSFAEPYIKADLHLSDREVGVLLGSFFLAYALAQVPAGWLSDRFGARAMLSLYVLLWSLFTGLMGIASSYTAVLLFRLGCGLAQAGAYPTSAALLSKWVPFSGRGVASSIVSVGGRLGGFAAPVLTAYLLSVFVSGGWRSVMTVFGDAGLLVAAAFWVLFRDRPGHHPRCNPAEAALIEHGRPAQATSPHGRARGLPLAAMLRSRSLWLISIAQFGTNFGWVFLLTWLPRYLEEVHEVPVLERGWMAGIPTLVGILGMLGGGWLTDRLTHSLGLRWGRRLPLACSRFTGMVAYAACLLLHTPWQATVAFSVVAFSTDLGTPAVWAYKQDVGGRHVGTILGWGNMWGNFGAMLSPILLILVIRQWGWNAAFLTCSGSFLLAGIASLGVDATIPIVPPEVDGVKSQ